MTAGQPAPPPGADTLVEQLRSRAADPARRTEIRPGGLGAIVGKLSLGGLGFGRGGGPRPASPADVRAAEEALGLTLPPFIVRVYTEVADGGFGPEEGLLPLARVVAETRRLRAGDVLPRGGPGAPPRRARGGGGAGGGGGGAAAGGGGARGPGPVTSCRVGAGGRRRSCRW